MTHSLRNPLFGIALMVASMACFSIMNIAIRDLSHSIPSPLMVFLRNAMSLFIMLPFVWQKGAESFRTTRMKGHFFRALIGSISMQLWFYSITIMPITEATALSFTTPLFVTLIAIFFLKEKAGIRRYGALVAGFIGALIIMRPGQGLIEYQSFYVIIGSMLMAVVTILVKTLSTTEPPVRIVFYMSLFMTIFSFPIAVPFFQPLSTLILFKAFLIALFSTFAHLTLVRAYRNASMTVLMPFDYTRLIFTGIMAYFLFGEMPDEWTIAGSLIIVASTVYIAHREAKLGKKPPLDITQP